MKLSVIVPVFNLEKYVEECIRSLCDQQVNFEYEVIVCDDASTDASAHIISSLSAEYPQLKPILKPTNGGLANNIRTLLAAVSGQYIAYLDGDDVALPGKLQKQVDYLDANTNCQMVFHESDMFDSATGHSLKRYTRDFYNWQHIPLQSGIEHLVRYGTYMQASSVMFRHHDNLDKTVPAGCKIILDYPFYILNAGYLNARIDFLPEVLGRYRVHEDSFGAQTQKDAHRREQCLTDIIHACELARQFGIAEACIEEGISHHQFATALFFLFKNDTERFQHWINLSADNKPFFSDKHQFCWQMRDHPEELIKRLRAGSAA